MFERLRTSIYFAWHSEYRPAIMLGVTLSLLLPTVGFFLYQLMALNNMDKQLKCLALNVYYEARGESLAGKYAVGMVTMNRVKSHNHPDTICKVVYHRAWNESQSQYVSAFSWTTQNVDLQPNSQPWNTSVNIAENLYQQNLPANIRPTDALFYHADHVKPYWAKSRKRLGKIGNHIFYK